MVTEGMTVKTRHPRLAVPATTLSSYLLMSMFLPGCFNHDASSSRAEAAQAGSTDHGPQSAKPDEAAGDDANERDAIARLSAKGAQIIPEEEAGDENNCMNRRCLSVGLEGSKFGNGDLADVRCIRRIGILTLSDTAVTDEGLKVLGDHTSICGLVIDSAKISDRAMDTLRRLKSLERLCLRRTTVTMAGISALRDLPRLETLDIAETKISNVALETGFPALREIELPARSLSTVRLAHLPRLTALSLGDKAGPPDVALIDLPHLTVLELWGPSRVNGQPTLSLERLPQLLEIVDQGRWLTDKHIEALPELPALKRFVSLSSLSEKSIAALGKFSSLAELSITSHSEAVPSRAFDSIRRLRELRSLSVRANAPDGIPQIGDLGKLERLSVTDELGLDITLKAAARLKNLKHLSLSCRARIPAESLGILNRMTSLETLQIGFPLTTDEVRSLRLALPKTVIHCPSPSTLDNRTEGE